MKKSLFIFPILSVLALCACSPKEDPNSPKTIELNVGLFPNVTHAQGLIAYQMSKEGRPWFEPRLSDNVKINWFAFNAGPSAMGSMLAGGIDLTYVGPNPAINSFIKSDGTDVRIIAGSADGGAGLVVNPKLDIKTPQDFKSKKIATPQYANTQDVAARAWVLENKMTIDNGAGGDVQIIPTKNPDQLALFLRGDIDAVWGVEPWITILEKNGSAKMYLFEKDAVTTVLVSSVTALKKNPELMRKFKDAHIELTKWMKENPKEAKELVLKGIESLTHSKGKISQELIDSAWQRIIFTPEINRKGIEKFVDDASACGFIKKRINMTPLFYNFEENNGK